MKQKIHDYYFLGILVSLLICTNLNAQNCACWQHRDTSFHCVPFSYCNSECGADHAPYYRNDDASTNAIILPFTFCFGGVSTDSVFINTNGNLTFGRHGAQFTSFSPDTFPQIDTVVPPMIAPFWGDVDLVGGTGGTDVVVYKITAHHLIVQWDSVGYFITHRTKLNSFQVIISDGTDSIIPSGNNVEFCYGNMQWTTGDASLGNGGFGGDPATVGFNVGDGVNYLQFGLFDTAGNSYYGQFPPAPAYDGVSWLSNNMFYYNTCILPLPPMVSGISPCDTEIVYSNDTVYLRMLFFTSKQGDTVIANPISTLPSGVSIAANIRGHIDSISIKVIGPLATLGYHTVRFYGYDKTNSHDTGFGSFVLNVLPAITTSSQSIENDNSIEVYPNPNRGIFTVACNLTESSLPIMEVYDLTGKQVLYATLSQIQGNNTIDMRGQPSGIYFYRILGNKGEQISNGKFVVEK